MGVSANKTIRSMPECIEQCGNTDGCAGAIWNVAGECWLKNVIGKGVPDLAIYETESAVLQQ